MFDSKALDEDDEEEGKKTVDEVAEGREQFLKIYKEDDSTKQQTEEPTLSQGIKFRRDSDEPDMESYGQKLRTSQ